MGIIDQGLTIGRFYFEEPSNLNLQWRITSAFQAYYKKFAVYPDTAHVRPSYCPEETILIINDKEVRVLPDKTMQPGITWIGNRLFEEMPEAVDSDLTIHFEEPEEANLFSERKQKWSASTTIEVVDPEVAGALKEQLDQTISELEKKERKNARRRARRQARKEKERASKQAAD